MPKGNFDLVAFNRGLISNSALARVDVARTRLSANTMTNWMPKTVGPMFLRTGTEHKLQTRNNEKARHIEFIRSTSQSAIIEVTDGVLRPLVDEAPITRNTVATAVTNGNFASSGSWTSTLLGGATSTFTGVGLTINGNSRGGEALVEQDVSVAEADRPTEHGLRIIVTRGPVQLRIGTATGLDDVIEERTLRTGAHSFAVLPGVANIFIQFYSKQDVNRIVASCQFEAAGDLEIASPWTATDLQNLRWTQSADVVFVCDGGLNQQRRIERWGTRSWSLVLYQPDDGPFTSARTNTNVRLKVDESFGNATMTADRAFFNAEHVGALFRIFHIKDNITYKLSAEEKFTDPIRVTGVKNATGTAYNDRVFTIQRSGSWVGSLTLERSDDESAGFGRFGLNAFTGNGTQVNAEDEDDNNITYYRMGFLDGDYTSGVAVVRMDYDHGGGYGIVRVTSFTSTTSVEVEVIRSIKEKDVYSDDWQEGLWSDWKGWPASVAFYEGRLFWAGGIYIFGSISDSYESFDQEAVGDSAPIIRTIGEGPVDAIRSLLPLSRLLLNTEGTIFSIRSTSFDEALTPANMQSKPMSTQGVSNTKAGKVDTRGIVVQRSKKRVYELVYDVEIYDYRSKELTILHPDLVKGTEIKFLVVQRQPDTRIHFGFANGKVAILTYEPLDELVCWSMFETDGDVEDAVILPGEDEDEVYYQVRRTIDGQTKRYLERWSLEADCVGGDINKQGDCFKIFTSASATTTITGADHLEGKTVVAWGNGKDLGTYVVSGGGFTVSEAVTKLMYGIGYSAEYRSVKMSYAAGMGTALTQPKRINYLGVILNNTHAQGLRYGPTLDDDDLDHLPLEAPDGSFIGDDEIFSEYDEPAFEFEGEWGADARLCLKASAPRPCMLLAAIIGLSTHDKA